MPMFDFICEDGHQFEALTPTAANIPCRECGKDAHRVWVSGNASKVIGDEIDLTVRHGLCWPDGTPRRFRSRQEWTRAQKETGLHNHVEHKGSRGSDKSKHTQRWI